MSTFIDINDYKQLITDDDLEVVYQADPANLDNAEKSAIEYFKGFIRGRYNVDLIFSKENDNRDKNLLSKLIDQVLYDLHSNLPGNLMPEVRERRKDELDEWLEKIQNGKYQADWPTWDTEDETDTGAPIKFGSNKKLGSNW
jgi:hypothetical protein